MPDFPLTVKDSYGTAVLFDVTVDGTVIIKAEADPIVLDGSAALDEFARAYIAVSHESERRRAAYTQHLEELAAWTDGLHG